MASRYVLNSNNLWLIAVSDRTIYVTDPGLDLNTHNLPRTIEQWRQVARVGSNSASTHRELEVFGVVFSGKNLEQLATDIINHQLFVNREGFMVMYFNQGHNSLVRRLNDLFDWSKYGVNVPTPLETVWDRFQLNTGKLMVDNKSAVGKKVEELSKLMQEKEKEIADLKYKLATSTSGSTGGNSDELQKLRNDVAAKDNQINALKAAMKALIS
ncbi:hypothetical protein LINGRAHAP2_LOCUS31532 [Linum grandiflorum]